MGLYAVLTVALLMAGCAAGFANPSGLSSVAGALEAVGSTATGFKATQSAAELNGANKRLLEAQTDMTRSQVEENQSNRERLDKERVVTARLLRTMSGTYHEAVFLTLADWVEAGGDPDFAFKYALARVDDDSRTKMVSQQTLSLPAATQPAPRASLPMGDGANSEAEAAGQPAASHWTAKP